MADYRIVIQGDGVKRYLPHAFAMCGRPDDLERLARDILRGVNDARERGTIFGWLVEHHPRIPDLVNTPPSAWSEDT